MKTREYSPSSLGLKNINLKAAQNTVYTSTVLDVSDLNGNFHLNGIVTESGTTNNGDITVSLVRFAKDGTTELDVISLVTSAVTTTSGVISVAFGKDFAPAELGLGTIGANLALARVFKKIAIRVTVTTQADGTTCTASFYLQAN